MFKSPTKPNKNGNLTMKEMRLRLSPMKPRHGGSGGSSTHRPFDGDLDESSDTEEASLYQEPLRLLDTNTEYRKLVKNYSCGRLCDYEDFESVNMKKKFGSTPLFNIGTAAAAAAASTVDRSLQQNGSGSTAAAGGVGNGHTTAAFGFRKPKTSKSFTNNLYEKDYRKPSFSSGYSIPVTKSALSLSAQQQQQQPYLALGQPPHLENYYAATDILQVATYFCPSPNSITF